MKQIINIQDYYPSIIATRKAISILKSEVAFFEKKKYVFSFSNISFISRSFADEFIKYLKSSNIEWELKNTNSNVHAIVKAVLKSHENFRSDYDHIAITQFESENELNKFLTTF